MVIVYVVLCHFNYVNSVGFVLLGCLICLVVVRRLVTFTFCFVYGLFYVPLFVAGWLGFICG